MSSALMNRPGAMGTQRMSLKFGSTPSTSTAGGFVLALLLTVAAIDERGCVSYVGSLGADGLRVREGEVVVYGGWCEQYAERSK